ncbi:hypothetical protein [Phycisphaera mikurensis]|uniref:DUF3788 family protein n=1 Tax=Phycisphaera mikurensis (strain NBRC 102666 / KCTC 22515 / FYK2301M01) TaxID=1142394 RepID=I0IG67_PHYMF|nr:hypothetical protein [Phycisphaera mikurensis]MBB6440362.1 hypothetical protein [Phycisphaera mikurensis]BAM04255.1 hypothetical protein PSMK_20960 [Phycisphaera mikurensis NBRC 102666]
MADAATPIPKPGMPLTPPPSVWTNRWAPPTDEELLSNLTGNTENHVRNLIQRVEDAAPGIQRKVIWHGMSWRWTIQFTSPSILGYNDASDQEDEPGRDLLYTIVPNPLEVLVVIPLRPEHLEHLPIRRLNRYIRDGIRNAKWAVDLRWVKWIPTANTEVEHLLDLLKRKAKIATGDSPSQRRSRSERAKGNAPAESAADADAAEERAEAAAAPRPKPSGPRVRPSRAKTEAGKKRAAERAAARAKG